MKSERVSGVLVVGLAALAACGGGSGGDETAPSSASSTIPSVDESIAPSTTRGSSVDAWPVRVDVGTVRSIDLSTSPSNVAIDPAGRFALASGSGGAICAVDIAAGRQRCFGDSLGFSVNDVGWDPAGDAAFLVEPWTRTLRDPDITRADLANDRLIRLTDDGVDGTIDDEGAVIDGGPFVAAGVVHFFRDLSDEDHNFRFVLHRLDPDGTAEPLGVELPENTVPDRSPRQLDAGRWAVSVTDGRTSSIFVLDLAQASLSEVARFDTRLLVVDVTAEAALLVDTRALNTGEVPPFGIMRWDSGMFERIDLGDRSRSVRGAAFGPDRSFAAVLVLDEERSSTVVMGVPLDDGESGEAIELVDLGAVVGPLGDDTADDGADDGADDDIAAAISARSFTGFGDALEIAWSGDIGLVVAHAETASIVVIETDLVPIGPAG